MDVKSRSNWTNKKIVYLKNATITEYDLQSGGLSVIKQNKLLDQKYIDKLDSFDKEKRNIAIGKLQLKIKSLAKAMVDGFGDARQMFADQNGLDESDILSIKKDAIFVINKPIKHKQVTEYLNFRPKNIYTSYMLIGTKEAYFSSMDNSLTIKGVSDDVRRQQADYLFKDAARFMAQGERVDRNVLYANLRKYRSDYLARRLPIETYRNIDTGTFSTEQFELDDADDSYIDDVDIAYDYIYFVLPMIRALME